MNIPVKIALFDKEATIPAAATPGSAGLDLYATKNVAIEPGGIAIVPTGIGIQLPAGYEAQIRSRSGLASKGIIVLNAPGTIDSDYIGEIKVILMNVGQIGFTAYAGSRIAQIIIAEYCRPDFTLVDELEETTRSDKGFGSTGT